jgi:hypothetical protein
MLQPGAPRFACRRHPGLSGRLTACDILDSPVSSLRVICGWAVFSLIESRPAHILGRIFTAQPENVAEERIPTQRFRGLASLSEVQCQTAMHNFGGENDEGRRATAHHTGSEC